MAEPVTTAPTLTLAQLQQRFAWQIVVGYLTLIALTLILYMTGGLLDEELPPLLATLSAISALYVAPLFQFISQNLRPNTEESQDQPIPLGRSLRLMLWIIPCHFVLVGALISAKSLNVISFKEMTIFLGFIETTFGTYMGFILTTLFKLEKK